MKRQNLAIDSSLRTVTIIMIFNLTYFRTASYFHLFCTCSMHFSLVVVRLWSDFRKCHFLRGGFFLLEGGTYWKAAHMLGWKHKVLIRGEALTWRPALVRGYIAVNQNFEDEDFITVEFKSHQMFMKQLELMLEIMFTIKYIGISLISISFRRKLCWEVENFFSVTKIFLDESFYLTDTREFKKSEVEKKMTGNNSLCNRGLLDIK